MTVKQLNRGQLVALKQRTICERDERACWRDMADADEIVTDAEIFAAYAGTEFSEEDF